MPYQDGIGWKRTDTSLEGAQAAKPTAATIKRRILVLFEKNPDALFTTEGIADLTSLPYRVVQPRISDLRNEGRIRDSGHRVFSSHNVRVIVWQLTPKKPAKETNT
jgi:hypothetical protein